MREIKRERHIVLSFIGGIAKHHTLVASTLVHGVFALHATIDIGTLFVDSREHAARVAFEHIFALRIANLIDYLACDELEINICTCLHFTSDDYLPSGN